MCVDIPRHKTVLFIVILLACLFIHTSVCDVSQRYEDVSFPQSMLVLGGNVTCQETKPGFYPERTWTCHQIRVDGKLLTFGYHPDMGGENLCTDTNGTNYIGAICLELLRSYGIRSQLWAATVSDVTCESTTETRMILDPDPTNHWKVYKAGRGYIITIHCTILPDE